MRISLCLIACSPEPFLFHQKLHKSFFIRRVPRELRKNTSHMTGHPLCHTSILRSYFSCPHSSASFLAVSNIHHPHTHMYTHTLTDSTHRQCSWVQNFRLNKQLSSWLHTNKQTNKREYVICVSMSFDWRRM